MEFSTPTCIEDHDVLVVEDDPEINRLVGAYVELAGFRYVSALTGAEALSAVQDNQPQAVVLDLMLPDINGMEICRRLKADLRTRKIPIIILTALDAADTRAQGLGYGASDYLTKPFDPDRLLDALVKLAGVQPSGEVCSR